MILERTRELPDEVIVVSLEDHTWKTGPELLACCWLECDWKVAGLFIAAIQELPSWMGGPQLEIVIQQSETIELEDGGDSIFGRDDYLQEANRWNVIIDDIMNGLSKGESDGGI